MLHRLSLANIFSGRGGPFAGLSGVLTGFAVSDGSVYLIQDGVLSSAFTFTRASSKYYINSSGAVASVANNLPTTDYTDAGVLLGLSIEEARTNYALYSRDLTNAVWTATNVTVTKNQTGRDGSANACCSLTATAGNGTVLQAITLASGARMYSCDIKRLVGSGTINMTLDNGATWTAVTVTSGWTRVTIPTQTLANPTVGFRIVTSGDAIAVDYTQLENGAFATSRIPTTSATVTRSADSAVISTLSSIGYSQTVGTMYLEGSVPTGAESVDYAAFSNNSTAEIIYPFWSSGSTTASLFVRDGNANQALIGRAYTSGAYKQAVAWALNDFAASFNGQAALTDTSGTLPTVDRFHIGAGVPLFTGLTKAIYFKTIRYWPERKADAALVTLTT